MGTAVVSSAANATPVLARKGPAFLQSYHLANLSAATRYVKLYDAAAAADVTVGTTVPVLIIPIGAAPAMAVDSMLELHFKLGIVWAVVTGAGDSNTTAGSARDVAGAIGFDAS
jgi:hypothetical protein